MPAIEPIYAAALIATAVSLMFGICANLQSLGLDHVDARTGAIVHIGAGTALAWVTIPFYLNPADLLTPASGYFALAGLIVPSISMAVSTVSVRIIGPSLTGGLASTSPMFAMLLAVIWIGEVVTPQVFLGTLIVIAGVMLVVFRGKSSGLNWPLWAIMLPFTAALTRGIAHPLLKLGLNELPSPMLAMLVSITVSIVVLYAWSYFEGHKMPAFNTGYKFFALSGFINGIGMILLNVALQIGTVSAVSPIIAAAPVFTLITGYLYFKREVFTWRTVAAILLIFLGSVMIVLR